MKKLFYSVLLFPVLAFPAPQTTAVHSTGLLVPNPPVREILGVFAYKGGFASRMIVRLPSPRFISSFQLNIPSFCNSTEVLEAGSVTEGVQDLATSLGESRYSINGGSGARISAIFATFNGPEGVACNIPVFNGSTPLPPTSKIQGTFLLDGVPKLTVGSGNQITYQAFRLTNPYGYSAPIVFATPLVAETALQYRASGNWTDVFTLPTGQTVQCIMPVTAQFSFDTGYDGLTLTLNFPQNVTYTGVECNYQVASQSFFLQRQ